MPDGSSLYRFLYSFPYGCQGNCCVRQIIQANHGDDCDFDRRDGDDARLHGHAHAHARDPAFAPIADHLKRPVT